MATVQIITDGPRNLVIKVDGTGAEVNTKIVDVTTLNPPCTSMRLNSIVHSLAPSAVMELLWDANTPVVAWNLFGSGGIVAPFMYTQGIPNNAGTGVTGNVLLNGGTASTNYSIYLEFIKNGIGA
ncbi:MAG: hypothetical protein KGI54_07085 [Pseudomonadota bacterium]|nr:hypothetical protein [Pseudomonadota bacterium]